MPDQPARGGNIGKDARGHPREQRGAEGGFRRVQRDGHPHPEPPLEDAAERGVQAQPDSGSHERYHAAARGLGDIGVELHQLLGDAFADCHDHLLGSEGGRAEVAHAAARERIAPRAREPRVGGSLQAAAQGRDPSGRGRRPRAHRPLPRIRTTDPTRWRAAFQPFLCAVLSCW